MKKDPTLNELDETFEHITPSPHFEYVPLPLQKDKKVICNLVGVFH